MEYLHDPRRVGLSLVGSIGRVVELNGEDYSTGGADVQLETTTRARTLPRNFDPQPRIDNAAIRAGCGSSLVTRERGAWPPRDRRSCDLDVLSSEPYRIPSLHMVAIASAGP